MNSAFAESRVKLIDWVETREDLHLDSPCRVQLHLQKPNVVLNTDSESMYLPQKIAWQLRTQFGGRHQLHGAAFETAETQGKARTRWAWILGQAAEARHGEILDLEAKS